MADVANEEMTRQQWLELVLATSRSPLSAAKDDVLSGQVAPYFFMNCGLTEQQQQCFVELYKSLGDLRLYCFVVSSKRPKKIVNCLHHDIIESLLLFGLEIRLNPKKVISDLWPVKRKDLWDSYTKHLVEMERDIWIEKDEYETCHHMFKKFVLESQSNEWHFIVKIDGHNLDKVYRYGEVLLPTVDLDASLRYMFFPTKGNVPKDCSIDLMKKVLTFFSIRELLQLTLVSKNMRRCIWLYLYRNGYESFSMVDACGEIDAHGEMHLSCNRINS